MSDQKRCLYEILGVNRDCSPEEIRSAYKKLALQLHPDKLISTGVSEEVATARFQEVLNAYEVLSDPRERAWYDSHRSQILFSDPNSKTGSSSSLFDSLNLFSYFSNSVFSGFSDTGKGFFKVYGDAFSKIYAQEVEYAKSVGLGIGAVRDAPLMGNVESPYSQVSAFYGYWLGFCTIMDFSWADEYHAAAGPNRKARRLMEEENKKARKKAKREYNDTVRGLAEFVKKRDKRVTEMQMKKRLEEEKKRAKEKQRKEEEARAKREKASSYQEPDWARLDERDVGVGYDDFEDEDDTKKTNSEFYCVVCSKKFKSEKQWINHEQSKKHKEKVAELRESFELEDEDEKEHVSGEDMEGNHVDSSDDVVELCEEFEAKSEINNKQVENNGVNHHEREDSELDDEASILEAMISGHRSRKDGSEHQPGPSFRNINIDDSDQESTMQYDNKKRTRNEKKKGGASFNDDNFMPATDQLSMEPEIEVNKVQDQTEKRQDASDACESSGVGGGPEKTEKPKGQSAGRQGLGQRDTNIKTKNSSKGRKQKANSKMSGNACDTCGENFDSRNKLFSHLSDTGHAALKSR